MSQGDSVFMVLLTEREREILERWLTQMSDRASLDYNGMVYARLLGKIVDASTQSAKTAARMAATLQIRERSPKTRRNMPLNLPKSVMGLLPHELRERGAALDPGKTERIVTKRREEMGLCPIHGNELIAVPAEHVASSSYLTCPDLGCDYRRSDHE